MMNIIDKLQKCFGGRIHPLIFPVDLTEPVLDKLHCVMGDLFFQDRPRGDRPLVAYQGKFILLFSCNAEFFRQHFRRLPHDQPAGRVGQP